MHRSFVNNSSTISAFLDIKGAFDNVIPNVLIQELRKIGIPARIRIFILSLICERQLHFVIDGNLSGPFFSLKGTPQDSTLSPILFDFISRISLIIYILNQKFCYMRMILSFTLLPITFILRTNLFSFLWIALRNTSLRRLDLSPEKSNWIVFTRARIFLLLS